MQPIEKVRGSPEASNAKSLCSSERSFLAKSITSAHPCGTPRGYDYGILKLSFCARPLQLFEGELCPFAFH
ncbi:MAG: hypothetical protein DLM52_02725 [Chthoniobacterales bacterium]|nr:MAG: hypothetical protein DLM52_02725 [Chthoniobacterales bacterium]